MRAIALSLDVLRQMPRPESYFVELRGCVVAEDERGLIFDADSSCYRTVIAKYQSYEPTGDDLERTIVLQNFTGIVVSRGVGDTVARVLEWTGIAALSRRAFRGDCGCKQRQGWLNDRFPYNHPSERE